MKNYTLIALAFALCSANASAQRFFKHDALHAGTFTTNPRILKKIVEKPKKRSAPMRSALNLPTFEQTYMYEDGEWVEDASYTYTYDASGNILTQVEECDGEQTKTVYEYNENGKVTRKTTMNGDGEGGFDNSSLLTQDYDERVPSLIVSSLEYTWDDNVWTMISAGRTWKRDVKRNDAGNVSGVSLNTYYDGDFELTQQTALEYGEDGKPTSWRYDELAYTDDGQYEMKEVYTLSDMTWHACDGQVVAMSLDEFHSGNNLLTHAVVYEPDYGQTGTIDATYDDDGGYEITYNYTEPLGRDVITFYYVGKNGGYRLETAYYEDTNEDGELTKDDLAETSTDLVMYDAHGNIMLEESYLDDEKESSIAYDYKYSDDSDYPVQQIYSEYNPETGDYEPFMKIVSSKYTDVTTVKSVAVDEINAPQSVYTPDGVRVGESTDCLPNGLYIVRKGATATKLLKR